MTRRVAVVGGTGYAGAELIRWLLAHPDVELAVVTSRSRAGDLLGDIHPGLLGLTDLRATTFDPGTLAALDAVLLAVPHGAARGPVGALEAAGAPRILDMSADHRHVEGWVYGAAEWHQAALRGATRIGVPGCFATAISLACAPFVAAGLVDAPVTCTAVTGSTGSGATPKAATHHPERFVNLKAYKVLGHQHAPEITTFLQGLGSFPGLRFVPLSGPFDRGILATVFLQPTRPLDLAGARAILEDAYANHPGVRLREGSPELRHVRGTGFCDLSVGVEDETVAVLSAIDNLGKGAAAQAVQCLNLAFGLPIDRGLRSAPCLP
jgi:N-acetyl-gamma-glutamyl-phosphate reductase